MISKTVVTALSVAAFVGTGSLWATEANATPHPMPTPLLTDTQQVQMATSLAILGLNPGPDAIGATAGEVCSILTQMPTKAGAELALASAGELVPSVGVLAAFQRGAVRAVLVQAECPALLYAIQ